MAGLTEDEFQRIDEQHKRQIATHLRSYPWQLVLVLTISNFPRTHSPRATVSRMVKVLYPTFLKDLARLLGASVDDCWVAERGKVTGRHHINVFLKSSVPIPTELPATVWRATADSSLWQAEYDPAKDVGYWIKELTAFEADVYEYGGSIIYQPIIAEAPTKPNRSRKSDYNQARPRVRYRPQE